MRFAEWMKELEKVADSEGFAPDLTFTRQDHRAAVWLPRYKRGLSPKEAWAEDTSAIASTEEMMKKWRKDHPEYL